MTRPLLGLLVLACGASCVRERPVLIEEGDPIRAGPKIDGRMYYLKDGQWILTEGRETYPEGWYLVPPSFVKPE